MMVGLTVVPFLTSLAGAFVSPSTLGYVRKNDTRQQVGGRLRYGYTHNSPLAVNTAGEKDEDALRMNHETMGSIVTKSSPIKSRRRVLTDVLVGTAAAGGGCACGGCISPSVADALAQITDPPPEALATYDLARDKLLDMMFAQGMAIGMRDYEAEAFPRKKRLFDALFASLEGIDRVGETVVAEVGMGSFPNAPFYASAGSRSLDIIGIDPNDNMAMYARDSAKRARIVGRNGNSLRVVHGVSEALPLADASCDAVVCTLTLCSVLNPEKSVAEIKRVLKPGGKFLFWEHVLSETSPDLAAQQIYLTPNQVKRADGCHLDRRTGETIKAAGFREVDLEYLELKNFSFLNPTVAGIATA